MTVIFLLLFTLLLQLCEQKTEQVLTLVQMNEQAAGPDHPDE